ncbi:hypothetical protein ACFQES_50495 [Nonomuraea salmonea]|uniref:hypothetical protein n=1 Tax=Nonomuraea salmonea TaxID=46181 RepID=UPI00361DC0E4
MPQQDRPGPPFNDRAEYEQAVRLAAARQRIAHENTGLPAWDDLPPEDQRPGVVAALHYLRAYQLAGLDHQLDHRDAAAPSEFALESVRRACNACTGLHGTTVVLEAARLLDDLAATAERHGHDLDIAIAGLASYAADTVTSRYDRPKPERSVDEVNALLRHLADAFTDAGLTTTACEVRAGVAVAPIPGVRAWAGPYDRARGVDLPGQRLGADGQPARRPPDVHLRTRHQGRRAGRRHHRQGRPARRHPGPFPAARLVNNPRTPDSASQRRPPAPIPSIRPCRVRSSPAISAPRIRVGGGSQSEQGATTPRT